MLKVIYKTKYYVTILDTDDYVVEKITLPDLTKLVKNSGIEIEGVELVRGRVKVTPSHELYLNPNLRLDAGVLLRLEPKQSNMTFRLSDWCYKIGDEAINLRIDKNGCKNITLIFDDNIALSRNIFKNRGIFGDIPYIFDIRNFSNVETIYRVIYNQFCDIDFLRAHIIDRPERFDLYVFALYLYELSSNSIMIEHGITVKGFMELAKLAKPEYGTAIYNIEFLRNSINQTYEFKKQRFHFNDSRLRELNADKSVDYLTYRCASALLACPKPIAYITIFGANVHPVFKDMWKHDVENLMRECGVFGSEGSPEFGAGLVNYTPDKVTAIRANKVLAIGGVDLTIINGVLQSVQVKSETAKTRVVLSKLCHKIDDNAFNNTKLRNLDIVFVFDDSLSFSLNLFKSLLGGKDNFTIDVSAISDDKLVTQIYRVLDNIAFKVLDKFDRRCNFFSRYLMSHRLPDISVPMDRVKIYKWFTQEELEVITKKVYQGMEKALDFLNTLQYTPLRYRRNITEYFSESTLKALSTLPIPNYALVYDLPLHIAGDLSTNKWHICVNCYYLFSSQQTLNFEKSFLASLSHCIQSIKNTYQDS